MNEHDYTSYIILAYIVAILSLGGLTTWIIATYLRLRKALGRMERPEGYPTTSKR